MARVGQPTLDRAAEDHAPGKRSVAVRRAWAILDGIVDPEIPAISIVDLGIVGEVTLAGRRLEVELLPTFIGCPALQMIQSEVIDQLQALKAPAAGGVQEVVVTTSFAVPWTAERITDRGRLALVASGFAPPPGAEIPLEIGLDLAPRATCPYCGSRRTVLENAFGPTRCRSIHYCTDCRQPFEQFKDA